MPEEPPYGVIWKQIEAGTVIPFLGAGASLGPRPTDDRGSTVPWSDADAAFFPSGAELGRLLADECRFPDAPESADLAKIASYYEVRARRALLKRRLHEIFARDYPIGTVHTFLAQSPRPLLIVTTNYDDLLERAFRLAGREFHLVTHPEERDEYAASVLWWKPGASAPDAFHPARLPLSLDVTSIIYKMHGSVARGAAGDSFVITEEDYVRFLARMTQKQAIPKRFMLHFKNSSFLFLGYGLGDWNLRVMLENLRGASGPPPARKSVVTGGMERSEDRLDELLANIDFDPDDSDYPSWAIQHNPSILERTLWSYRNIQIFDVMLDEFVARIEQQRKRPSALSSSSAADLARTGITL